MQTKYSYWLFRDAIQEKDRKKIKHLASKSGYKEATMKPDDDFKNATPDKKLRNSSSSFSDDQYFYELFCPFVGNANRDAGWNYDIDWYENVQIARYKKDQHYSWHKDGAGDHFGVYTDQGNLNGKVRKLSLVSCISNGFDGGELEFSIQGSAENKNLIFTPELKIGDVIVFPSFVQHRSTPITKGTKYSVAMWCLGPPFR